ncbi:MAG: hypothetical protein HY925_08425 [Elusimicrobia bacterium]|nr:hypothetical protein [Elusimicrobiota bacterium]
MKIESMTWIRLAALLAAVGMIGCRPGNSLLGQQLPVQRSLLGTWRSETGMLTVSRGIKNTYALDYVFTLDSGEERVNHYLAVLSAIRLDEQETLRILNIRIGNRWVPAAFGLQDRNLAELRFLTGDGLEEEGWNESGWPEGDALASYFRRHRNDESFAEAPLVFVRLGSRMNGLAL